MTESSGKKLSLSKRFSADEDDVLIEFVQNHTILYDLKHSDFKNLIKKDVIWKKAGKILKRNGYECKKRWKNIRDNYKKEKKQEKVSTGRSAKKKRATYWERLGFLDMVEDERKTVSSITTTTDNESEISVVDSGEETEETSSIGTTSVKQTVPLSSSVSGEVECRSKNCKRKRDDIFLDEYLKEKKEDREHIKRCLEEFVKQPTPEVCDETDLFFKSLAVTVKKFKPDLITRTKAKIFEIVTEMDLMNQESILADSTKSTNINSENL